MDRRTFNKSVTAALACAALPKVDYNAVIDDSFGYGIKNFEWTQEYGGYEILPIDRESNLKITYYLDAKCTKERMLEFRGTSYILYNTGKRKDNLELSKTRKLYYEMYKLNIFKLGTKIKVKTSEVAMGESYDIESELVSCGGGEILSCFFCNYKLTNIENYEY